MKMYRDIDMRKQKRAWLLGHKIRKIWEYDPNVVFEGPVEVDEMFPDGIVKYYSRKKRAMRIRRCSSDREPDDGGGAEYDNRRKQEEDKIRSLEYLSEGDLDREAERLDLESMYERDILQRNLDELANRHSEEMRRNGRRRTLNTHKTKRD